MPSKDPRGRDDSPGSIPSISFMQKQTGVESQVSLVGIQVNFGQKAKSPELQIMTTLEINLVMLKKVSLARGSRQPHASKMHIGIAYLSQEITRDNSEKKIGSSDLDHGC